MRLTIELPQKAMKHIYNDCRGGQLLDLSALADDIWYYSNGLVDVVEVVDSEDIDE